MLQPTKRQITVYQYKLGVTKWLRRLPGTSGDVRCTLCTLETVVSHRNAEDDDLSRHQKAGLAASYLRIEGHSMYGSECAARSPHA